MDFNLKSSGFGGYYMESAEGSFIHVKEALIRHGSRPEITILTFEQIVVGLKNPIILMDNPTGGCNEIAEIHFRDGTVWKYDNS